MKYTYTEIKNEQGELLSVTRSDGASIPADPANADYQRYLNPEADQPIGGKK
jgi:hypothetical protein